MSIYDLDCVLGCRLLKVERDKIKAVREFVLSRRSDIEQNIENFGMLKPVLDYFLEARAREG